MPEPAPDVLDPLGPVLPGAGSLRTDGDWIWRADLAHYVEKYHLMLPVDFLSLVRSRAFVVPRVPSEQLRAILTTELGIRLDPWLDDGSNKDL
ncbi:hypothetical protein GBW32_32095 [Streptomyces tsukubensis]|uniref:Uncharacterized protein n=1 Tax=Streptomyces tsukubensis TaxID=83656 RepID=A0A1V4A1Q2_9ACTN|nr:hypothetical protein B1H18_28725 [Streptomyces tsukubensis]QFR98174.1 hypothetical protein GBW32_32095 [Streptomyces tsukubensis]